MPLAFEVRVFTSKISFFHGILKVLFYVHVRMLGSRDCFWGFAQFASYPGKSVLYRSISIALTDCDCFVWKCSLLDLLSLIFVACGKLLMSPKSSQTHIWGDVLVLQNIYNPPLFSLQKKMETKLWACLPLQVISLSFIVSYPVLHIRLFQKTLYFLLLNYLGLFLKFMLQVYL